MLVSKKQEWVVHEERTPSVPVKPAPAINAKLRRRCLILAATMAIMAMVVTVQSEMIVRSGYGLVELKKQAASLEKENEILRLEIAKLKSPQRIQNIAVNQLGMVTPQTMLYASNSIVAPANTQTGQERAHAQVPSIFKAGTAEASKGR